jgi:hypothetical protein
MKRQRGPSKVVPVAASEVTLPPTPFLYTLDQVAVLIGWPQARLEKQVHFIGRSLGGRMQDQLQAMNVAEAGDKPDWRISESEFMRWLIRMGYVITKLHY